MPARLFKNGKFGMERGTVAAIARPIFGHLGIAYQKVICYHFKIMLNMKDLDLISRTYQFLNRIEHTFKKDGKQIRELQPTQTESGQGGYNEDTIRSTSRLLEAQ